MKKDSSACFDGRVTEWLPPHGACGPTCHERCRNNIQWCKAEQEWLARKGIASHIETNEDGLIALFTDRGAQDAPPDEAEAQT